MGVTSLEFYPPPEWCPFGEGIKPETERNGTEPIGAHAYLETACFSVLNLINLVFTSSFTLVAVLQT